MLCQEFPDDAGRRGYQPCARRKGIPGSSHDRPDNGHNDRRGRRLDLPWAAEPGALPTPPLGGFPARGRSRPRVDIRSRNLNGSSPTDSGRSPQPSRIALLCNTAPRQSRRTVDMAVNRQGRCPAASARCRPEITALFRLVQRHLETYRAGARRRGGRPERAAVGGTAIPPHGHKWSAGGPETAILRAKPDRRPGPRTCRSG